MHCQFAGQRECHPNDPSLGGGICNLANLPFKCGHGRCIHNDTTCTILLRRIEHHGCGRPPDRVKGGHEIDLNDALEALEVMEASFADELLRNRDPSGVHHNMRSEEHTSELQ